MAKGLKLTVDVVGAGAGLHADQAGWDVGQPLRGLRTGELNPQHNDTALILADQVEAVLA